MICFRVTTTYTSRFRTGLASVEISHLTQLSYALSQQQQQPQSNLFVPKNQKTAKPSSSQPTVLYQEVRPPTAWNDPPIVQQKVKQPTVPKEIGIDQSKLFQPSNFISIPYGQPTIAPITRTQTPNSNGYIQ